MCVWSANIMAAKKNRYAIPIEMDQNDCSSCNNSSGADLTLKQLMERRPPRTLEMVKYDATERLYQRLSAITYEQRSVTTQPDDLVWIDSALSMKDALFRLMRSYQVEDHAMDMFPFYARFSMRIEDSQTNAPVKKLFMNRDLYYRVEKEVEVNRWLDTVVEECRRRLLALEEEQQYTARLWNIFLTLHVDEVIIPEDYEVVSLTSRVKV